MYYSSRAQAGRMLAKKLDSYATKNCVVIALNPGAVIVGAQIAMRLHANLMMLLTENIVLPGVPDAFASINSNNIMTYNKSFYTGEIDELHSEYFHTIEAQRLEKLHLLHKVLGPDGEISRDMLNRRVIILVSDGLYSGHSLDVAGDYLKPIKSKKIVVVAPIASVSAVDRMHLVGDEMICLDVRQNYIATNHYYEDNTIPPTDDLFKIIRNISLSWMMQSPKTKVTKSAHS